MGEYARLNKMLKEHEERYHNIINKLGKTEEDFEEMAHLWQSIGEIEGALLEMAEIDGLDDPYEAFDSYYDYCPSSTNRDYSPSNPWDAPGMCVSDFI